MKKISPSEVRLLLIFLGAVLVMGNVLLLRYGLNVSAENRKELETLREQLASYVKLKERSGYWAVRNAWRKENPLPTLDVSKSDSAFVEQVQQSLTSAGLRIEEQQLKDPVRKDGFVAIVLVLKVTGGLENHVRWMAEVQKPGRHLQIANFTLKAANEGSTMVATMELSQYFAPPGLAAAP